MYEPKHKPMKTKVLYFHSNTPKNYIELYYTLRKKFDNLTEIDIEEVNEFLESIDEKFYIKELSYQLELYNIENEYVFCINKPN